MANLIQCNYHSRLCADCLEKVVKTRSEEILYQKVSLSPRLPEVVLKNAWQVQHADHHQRGTSTGQPKQIFRIQGTSHAAVEQEEDNRTRLIKKFGASDQE